MFMYLNAVACSLKSLCDVKYCYLLTVTHLSRIQNGIWLLKIIGFNWALVIKTIFFPD